MFRDRISKFFTLCSNISTLSSKFQEGRSEKADLIRWEKAINDLVEYEPREIYAKLFVRQIKEQYFDYLLLEHPEHTKVVEWINTEFGEREETLGRLRSSVARGIILNLICDGFHYQLEDSQKILLELSKDAGNWGETRNWNEGAFNLSSIELKDMITAIEKHIPHKERTWNKRAKGIGRFLKMVEDSE